ncbi:MAG: hypothetical protein ABI868_24825 [Acidobacteriota bacterium]
MQQRFQGAAGLLLILAAGARFTTQTVSTQASGAVAQNRPAKPYTPARTPDGQPDLQGFWTNSTYTPLERPDTVTKELYTPDELAAVIKQAAQREGAQTAPGTTADVHYDFSQFGLDRSQSSFARNLRTSLIVNPENGKLPLLTEEGKKRAAESAAAARRVGRWDSAESNQLDDRCLIMAGAGPPMLDAAYNSNYHIVQGVGHVMILTEMIHDVRVIPLDGRPQPHSNIRQWMGISRGRWEGDTLVVETTNFNGKNPLRGSSENIRVTERFTRVADDAILYRFTVEDPSTWTRAWTAEMPMLKTTGPLFEHACHEGNYGLYNTLVGARLEEKNAAEAAAKKGGR